jgi:hypothetical protein
MYRQENALADVEEIQFCDNTFSEAIDAKVAVKSIIIKLGSKQDELVMALRELIHVSDKKNDSAGELLRVAVARAKEVLQ